MSHEKETNRLYNDLNERFEKLEVTPTEYLLAVHGLEKTGYKAPSHVLNRVERINEALVEKSLPRMLIRAIYETQNENEQ